MPGSSPVSGDACVILLENVLKSPICRMQHYVPRHQPAAKGEPVFLCSSCTSPCTRCQRICLCFLFAGPWLHWREHMVVAAMSTMNKMRGGDRLTSRRGWNHLDEFFFTVGLKRRRLPDWTGAHHRRSCSFCLVSLSHWAPPLGLQLCRLSHRWPLDSLLPRQLLWAYLRLA